MLLVDVRRWRLTPSEAGVDHQMPVSCWVPVRSFLLRTCRCTFAAPAGSMPQLSKPLQR